MNNKDIRLDLLKIIELNPQCTQRELAIEARVSLGKVNYCLKKLTEKGFLKLINFKNSPNKIRYAYLLTPKGLEKKSKLTVEFLQIKIIEYNILKKEIIQLKKESEQINLTRDSVC
jgi:EPS-associated MarR family transcriptional regulator